MVLTNPLICTDPGLSSIGMTDKVRNLISEDFSSSFYEETPANPTEKAVNEALELYKTNNGCDGVVGFGGGSSMDLAKAVALMANHEGSLIRLLCNRRRWLWKNKRNNAHDSYSYHFWYWE